MTTRGCPQTDSFAWLEPAIPPFASSLPLAACHALLLGTDRALPRPMRFQLFCWVFLLPFPCCGFVVLLFTPVWVCVIWAREQQAISKCQIARMCTFLLAATRAGVPCGLKAPEVGSLLPVVWQLLVSALSQLTFVLTSERRCSLFWERWPGGLFFFLINLWIKLIVPAAQQDCICFPLGSPSVFSDTAVHSVGWGGADDAGGESGQSGPLPRHCSCGGGLQGEGCRKCLQMLSWLAREIRCLENILVLW